MRRAWSELFLLVSVLVLASAVFIFSAWYAPNLFDFSPSNPDNSQTENTTLTPPKEINITSKSPTNATNSGLITQSLTGLEQLYNDAVKGILVLF